MGAFSVGQQVKLYQSVSYTVLGVLSAICYIGCSKCQYCLLIHISEIFQIGNDPSIDNNIGKSYYHEFDLASKAYLANLRVAGFLILLK